MAGGVAEEDMRGIRGTEREAVENTGSAGRSKTAPLQLGEGLDGGGDFVAFGGGEFGEDGDA